MHRLNTLRRSLIPPTFYFLVSIFTTRNSTYMVIIGHCRVISKNPPPTTPCHTCLISPCDNPTQFLLSSPPFFPPYPSRNEPNTVKLSTSRVSRRARASRAHKSPRIVTHAIVNGANDENTAGGTTLAAKR